VPALYSILTVPTFAARCLSASYMTRQLQVAKGGTYLWARNLTSNSAQNANFHVHSRGLLHAVNLQHGTDGFTSPPKEGALRNFLPLKIRRLQPGLNPRTLVLKANTLPLDHRSFPLYYILLYLLTAYLTLLSVSHTTRHKMVH
jgi:hypothetical protein